MRENRTYGSEGGEGMRPSLPLSPKNWLKISGNQIFLWPRLSTLGNSCPVPVPHPPVCFSCGGILFLSCVSGGLSLGSVSGCYCFVTHCLYIVVMMFESRDFWRGTPFALADWQARSSRG